MSKMGTIAVATLIATLPFFGGGCAGWLTAKQQYAHADGSWTGTLAPYKMQLAGSEEVVEVTALHVNGGTTLVFGGRPSMLPVGLDALLRDRCGLIVWDASRREGEAVVRGYWSDEDFEPKLSDGRAIVHPPGNAIAPGAIRVDAIRSR